jgi:hypothetical protein
MRTRITITSIGALLLFSSNAFTQDSSSHPGGARGIELFQTSDQCIGCHSNLHTANGQDVSIGYSWRASMMANSARDPYWHAAVRREAMDHPAARAAIEDKCSTCHMPMHRFTAAQQGAQGEVFANIGAALITAPSAAASDGVSCTVCHQIQGDNFGDSASFTGGFLIDTTTVTGQRTIYGPHDVDAGRRRVMQSAAQFVPGESAHLQESEMCATCHTLYTHALDESGNEIGELAEQVPYLEWLHSAYRATRSCQSCHMPELTEDVAISSVLGQPRPQFSQHVFRGGNVFMLGILNRYRGELGVQALPQEFAMTIRRTREYLETSAARLSTEARVSGQSFVVDVAVANLAGHKLPTAYPSRRAWLHLTVTDDAGRVVFESGAVRPDGSIVGNDNDSNASSYEPHYELIEQADQVQIYEPILVDSGDRVTTGLLSGVRYVKDNRILPPGFDKHTAAADIGVFGAAAGDDDFIAGGDRVRYRIPLGGLSPWTVDVRLWYQTIGFRWAENLKRYDAAETNRFVSYYAENAAGSAVQLAAAETVIER